MRKICIYKLGQSHLIDAARLLILLNPKTPVETLTTKLQTIFDKLPHYEIFGAFLAGKLVGVAGAWIATKIWCGRYLEIDNLFVDPESRSKGIGSRLIGHIVEIAKERDCEIIRLDSYSSNHASHHFYHRLGFKICGGTLLKWLVIGKGAVLFNIFHHAGCHRSLPS
jgi:ribosomal protein S18 acetylase RimI-like enzyme